MKKKLLLIIALLIIILVVILFIIFNRKSTNYLIGTWYCKYYDTDNYIVELNIDSKNTFMWSKYQDKENNYIIGRYKISKLDQKEENVYYYNLVLDSDNYVENSKKLNKYHKEYSVARNTLESKMILKGNNLKFICDMNPVIEK